MTDSPGSPIRPEDRGVANPSVPLTTASTQSYETPDYGSSATTSPSTSSSTTDVAKDQASAVKDTAVSAGGNVVATAKDEATNVAQETKQQARGLLDTVGSEVRDQAGTQQQRIATAVHSLSKELGGMASASDQSGPLTDLAHEASRRGGEIAHWLENREPRDVLEEVKSFGRRRPVAFLGLCALAGVVAGRITRGAVAANTKLDSGSSSNALTSAPSDRAIGSASYGQSSVVSDPGPTYQPAYESAPGTGSIYSTGAPDYTGTPEYTGAPGYTTGAPGVVGEPTSDLAGFPDPATTWTDRPADTR